MTFKDKIINNKKIYKVFPLYKCSEKVSQRNATLNFQLCLLPFYIAVCSIFRETNNMKFQKKTTLGKRWLCFLTNKNVGHSDSICEEK